MSKLFFKNLNNLKMKRKIITLASSFCFSFQYYVCQRRQNVLFLNLSYPHFPRHLSHAKEVTWENFGNYFKATFWFKGKTIYAFYSEDGEFMGDAINVLS